MRDHYGDLNFRVKVIVRFKMRVRFRVRVTDKNGLRIGMVFRVRVWFCRSLQQRVMGRKHYLLK